MEQSSSSIREALRSARLLDTEQWDELVRAGLTDAPELLDDLVGRGWLSQYQADQLRLGKANQLILEPYLLIRPLGRGGMGQVYQALHRRMKRVVAIKVIRPELLADDWTLRRFHREIEAVARLSHPNIVIAHDADEVDGTHYLVMEFVEGVDLAHYLDEVGRLDPVQAIDIVRQVCLALQHAHEQGLIHRDIKPSNLMLSSRGVVKVLDLGLARINPLNATPSPAGSPLARLTPAGTPVGTPDYLAPEQLLDPSGADIRSDLYSLGCTFYHLLAGRPPFHAGNLFQTFLAHRESEPMRLELLRPDLPAGLGDLVRRLMAKRPADRFATPAEVVAALDAIRERAGVPAWREPARTLPEIPVVYPEPTPAVGTDTTIDLGAAAGILPRDIPIELVPIESDAAGSLGAGLVPLEPIPEPEPEPGFGPRTEARGTYLSARAEAALGRAWSLLRWGDAARALAEFDQVLADHADEPRAWLGRGRARTQLGDFARAIDDLNRYVELCRDDAEGHHQRGLARLQEGSSRRKAIEDFTRALELDPRHVQALLHRGLAFARRRDDPRALADYDEALRLDPGLAQAHFYRGLVHDRHQRYEQSVADYAAAIRLDPQHARAYNNRGSARMGLGRLDDAIGDFRQALRIDPRYAVAHQNLGLALLEKADYDQALAHLNRAARLDTSLDVAPALARTYLQRGQERYRRRDHPSAVVDFTEALRLDPGLTAAYVGRGVALAKLGDPGRAIADLNEAIRLNPDHAQAYYNRGLLRSRQGDAAGAQSDREIALRLDPSLGRKG
jgi:serine/threonine protein kinase/tetratricopeptide (TPR) repeat protein